MTAMAKGSTADGAPGAGALGGFGRYAGPATLILSSLADGAKHGYALTKDIEEFAGVRLAPGTLYEALSRLEGPGPHRGAGERGPAPALPAHRRRARRRCALTSTTSGGWPRSGCGAWPSNWGTS